MRVVGIDGCKAGWVAVVLDASGVTGVEVCATVNVLIETCGPVEVVGIDMPIGLPQEGLRDADRLARKRIGVRASSVFSTPPRAALDAQTYEQASALSRRHQGRGLSKQSFNLLPKIREVDALVRRPGGPRVVEVHPEVSFRALHEADLRFSKKTWNGQMLRRRLLAHVGVEIPGALGAAGAVPADDVLDAAAVAWSARRVAAGQARSLPESPPRDGEGIEMAIWY